MKDEKGQIIGERMDNLVHASANPADAEREIKLWFNPSDIMPYMRPYPTVRCTRHYYYKDRTLYTSYVPDSYCIMAPGALVWQSDLETLEKFCRGEPITSTIESVVAKYLINEETIAC
jgi:nucleoside-diphosphate kinase